MFRRSTILIFTTCLVLASSVQGRSFDMFQPGYEGCYDRAKESYTFVVDAHNHFRPFGGEEVPFEAMLGYLQKMEIFFVNIYGIGQKLPPDSPCTYYLDCPGVPVTPSLSNDFVNADNIATRLPDKLPKDMHLTLAMTFPDLAEPEEIEGKMVLLDREYPGMFTWMGEINMVKQAIFPNHYEAVPIEAISRWKRFMDMLERRKMPISFHSDIGNSSNPTKYLPLMKTILRLYPRNTIVWHHMGLSKELPDMNPNDHIATMKQLLDANQNLYLDISWRVIYDNYFSKPRIRSLYVTFLNDYHDRILPGTDFVASIKKTFDVYKKEVELTSDIQKDLNNEAFRAIALGGNYFKIMQLPYIAPKICGAEE